MASFDVGDAVDCLSDGKAWAPYVVSRVRPDRRVDLRALTGGARLHRVDPRRLRARGTAARTARPAPPPPERADASPRAAGRRVAVAFHGGRRRCGEVLRRGRGDHRRTVVAAGAAPNARARYEVGAEGPLRFDVAYDEGGVERGVPADRVRPLSPARDRGAAADDAVLVPAEALRATWRRRRDGATAGPAADAAPWPRFARCAVLAGGEWQRGAVTGRRPGVLLVALDGARRGAASVEASYDQILRLPDAHEALDDAADAPAADATDLRAGLSVVVEAAGSQRAATITRCRLDGTLDVAFEDAAGGTRARVAPGDVATKASGGQPPRAHGRRPADELAPAVAARVRAALAEASRGAPGGVRGCLAPLARGGRMDRGAVEALLARRGLRLSGAERARLWAVLGGDDLESMVRSADGDDAERRRAANAADALRHELRRCAARVDGKPDVAAVFREAAGGEAAVDVDRLLDRVGARLGFASRRAVAARLDRRGNGSVDEAAFVAFVCGADDDTDDASSTASPPRETMRLADDWDDLFAGGNAYATERAASDDDGGERAAARRDVLWNLRRGLGAWLASPRYREQLRRCPRDPGAGLAFLRLLKRRDLDAGAREFASDAPLGPSFGTFMQATAAWAEGALAELGSTWVAGPKALCAAVGALRDLPRGALLDNPAALAAAGVAPPSDRTFMRTLERLADAEPLGRALPRPRRDPQLAVGTAVTVHGTAGTVTRLCPDGRVDVAGRTLASLRRGDVTCNGRRDVPDAAVSPPVRWRARHATPLASAAAGPPPWATAPKRRGIPARGRS